MASPDEILRIFDTLKVIYHYAMRDLSQGQISDLHICWLELLQDIDGDVLKLAATQHMAESKFFPVPAELREISKRMLRFTGYPDELPIVREGRKRILAEFYGEQQYQLEDGKK